MTTHDHVLASGDLPAGEPAAPPSRWIKSMRQWLAAWADTCANHWAAATMYEHLSALSGAELARLANQIPIAPADRGAPHPAVSFPGGFRTPADRPMCVFHPQ